ncbi:hypothetical protein [Nonomuraea sp. 10N515B]|uniref:hypothetical protein n=1 Tax=Nonomuraea sp. 10N515B TaxID=3457422 RepID=UPI003FCDA580
MVGRAERAYFPPSLAISGGSGGALAHAHPLRELAVLPLAALVHERKREIADTLMETLIANRASNQGWADSKVTKQLISEFELGAGVSLRGRIGPRAHCGGGWTTALHTALYLFMLP